MIGRRKFLRRTSAVGASLTFGQTSISASERKCEDNLHIIYEAVTRFRKRWGKFPPSLSTLATDGIVDEDVLICPEHRSRGTNTPRTSWPTEDLEKDLGMDEDPLTLYQWQLGLNKVGALNRRQQTMGIGQWAPMVRCGEHPNRENQSFLNLRICGGIFRSGRIWEYKMRDLVPYPYLTAKALIDVEHIVPLRDRFLPRRPESRTAQIDLGPIFNAALEDPWPEGYAGEQTSELRRKGELGLWKIGEIDFEIRGVVQLEGSTLATARFDWDEARYPRIAKLFLDHRPVAERINLLCGMIDLGEVRGNPVAKMVVVDSAGGRHTSRIMQGSHVCHDTSLDDGAEGTIVWKRVWDRPRPARPPRSPDLAIRSVSQVAYSLERPTEIAGIEFEAADEACMPFLLAVTAQ